jgi:hypothetical protein
VARHFPAFGLGVELAFELPVLEGAVTGAGPGTLDVQLGSPPVPAAGAELVWQTVFDGLDYAMHRLGDGSHRFVYGDRATFHLSSDTRRLWCDVEDGSDSSWQRLFLDTILWSCSYLRGFELLHASAVASRHGAVALVSGTGAGKTSLAAELLRRGATLLCDDVLALDRVDGRLAGHPGPPVMNLPETTAPLEGERRLASFPGERWVRLERVASAPVPLAAICMLERRAGEDLALVSVDCTTLDLLPHAFAFNGTSERAARRFELLSEVATEVPVYRLVADVDVAPGDLADLVHRQLLENPTGATVS